MHIIPPEKLLEFEDTLSKDFLYCTSSELEEINTRTYRFINNLNDFGEISAITYILRNTESNKVKTLCLVFLYRRGIFEPSDFVLYSNIYSLPKLLQILLTEINTEYFDNWSEI